MACSLATATVAAHAEDACDGSGCISIAWPNYADMVSTESDVEALLAAGGLSIDEADVITALVVRRQALRIRGLELRYLVGKTATSESKGTDKLDHIRHQIASIEEEIGYIDRELTERLDAFGKQTGPWIVSRTDDACTQYWFVARSPCDMHQDISLQSVVKPHWLETDAKMNALADVDLPGVCAPYHLGLRCPSPPSDEAQVLHIDGTVVRFRHGD